MDTPGVPDLIRVLEPLTKRIVFSHYGDWFYEDVRNNLKKLQGFSTPDLEIIPAHDGFEIQI